MKAIHRVIIEDFQSHRNTEIELAPGFNVIVGPSDQGKTAILRAIRWVLYNDPRGTDFIRAGATKAKVTLVMNDGTLITRERSSSRNRYSVAGPGEEEQWYEGFGQGVPEEVMVATGVRPVKLDEDHQVTINLGMQLAPPFLLDNNGAIKAKAIGRINGVHILDYAHKTTSSELSSKQIEERRIQADLEKVNEQLDSYADLEDWQRKLEQVDKDFTRVKELDQGIEWFGERLGKRSELAKKLQLAGQYLEQLSTLDQAGDKWAEAGALEQKGSYLIQLGKRLMTTRKALQEADQVISKTETLEFTTSILIEAEKKANLLGSLEKAAEQMKRLDIEKSQIHTIVNKTELLDQGERRFSLLLETSLKEEQLVNFHSKQQDYHNIREKIELVLVKTDHILLAEQRWDQWKLREQDLEVLLAYQRRLDEGRNQLGKLRSFIDRTEQLDPTWEMLKSVEAMVEHSEELERCRVKMEQLSREKGKLGTEVKTMDDKLEAYAKQYYQELKKIGRCPICLGEIESHTVQRIVAEMNG